MCIRTRIWNIAIPKATLQQLIDKLDADEDGYIAIGEVRDLLRRYGRDAKRSLKYRMRRR